ncbi:integral membrane protein [Fusarium beomiforme]|uniref:Integral membrane protein n=1 Tax=Fusarium beomiforme TaxID=44412 RepID=A0A9P5DYW1_9HYPO|nr:integral membrane protein [Fusarium beomiforme]
MWDTFFYRGAFVISAIPGLIGINSMLRPEATLKLVKFPIPAEPQSRNVCLSLARLQGARNIVVSYLFINNALTGDRKLMGMGLLGALFMLLTDGFIRRNWECLAEDERLHLDRSDEKPSKGSLGDAKEDLDLYAPEQNFDTSIHIRIILVVLSLNAQISEYHQREYLNPIFQQ